MLRKYNCHRKDSGLTSFNDFRSKKKYVNGCTIRLSKYSIKLGKIKMGK